MSSKTTNTAEYELFRKKFNRYSRYVPRAIEKIYLNGSLGHLTEKHVNVSEKTLRQRCEKEGKKKVTSFYGDYAEITKMIYRKLIDSVDEIAEFMAFAREGECYELEGTIIKSVSTKAYYYGMGLWKMETDTYVIVLSKNSEDKLIVKSVYPE